MGLLLLGAVEHERGADHVGADAHVARGRAEVGGLLVVNHLLDVGPALAAVLLWPGEGEPAALGHLGRQLADVEPVLVVEVGVGVDAAPVLAQVIREEVADLLAECFLFIRETVVHGVLLVAGSA